MKLSQSQEKILNEAKQNIDKARQYDTFEEYFILNPQGRYKTPEEYKEKDLKTWNSFKGYWEDNKNGIVLIHCSSKSLEKLQELGLIEIIEISTGRKYGIDKIKVLNY